VCEKIIDPKKFFRVYRKNTFLKLKSRSRTGRENFFDSEKKYDLDFEKSIENPISTEKNFLSGVEKIRFLNRKSDRVPRLNNQ